MVAHKHLIIPESAHRLPVQRILAAYYGMEFQDLRNLYSGNTRIFSDEPQNLEIVQNFLHRTRSGPRHGTAISQRLDLIKRQRVTFNSGRAVRLPGQGLALHIWQPAYTDYGPLYLGLKLGSLLYDFEKVLSRAEFRVKCHKYSIADSKA